MKKRKIQDFLAQVGLHGFSEIPPNNCPAPQLILLARPYVTHPTPGTPSLERRVLIVGHACMHVRSLPSIMGLSKEPYAVFLKS